MDGYSNVNNRPFFLGQRRFRAKSVGVRHPPAASGLWVIGTLVDRSTWRLRTFQRWPGLGKTMAA